MSGKKIIDALKDAVAGDLSRVTIDGETWARVKDIHADQQEIMRVNNSLREALLDIKSMVVGDKVPNWQDHDSTFRSRSEIANIIDLVVT